MPIRWLLIFWMFAISAISFLDRVNISIAGRFIQQEFHITDLQLGNVFSAFLVGYALFQTPAGRLADRFGPRLILTLGTLWWGVFTALTAMVSAGMASLFLVLLAARFPLGAGESVLFPASNRLVANWIPSRERGLANGIIFAGVGVGAGIPPPLVTHIVLHYGWRASFWISAVIGLAAGAVWYWLPRDRAQNHPRGTPQETASIEQGLPESPAELEIGKPLPWRVILGSKDVLAIAFSYFTYGYAAWIFFAWFFIYLSDVRGLDLKSSSYYATLPFIAMATGSTVGGRTQLVGISVIVLRAGELAEPDGDHLEEAAFDFAHEIGVPLHAAGQQHAIAFVGVAVHVGLDALRRFAEGHDVERAAHRAADGFFDDAVMREHVRLAFSGGGAVTAHGREDEGVHALRFPILGGGARDGSDIGDAAAAHADGQGGSGCEALGKSGVVKLPLDFGGHIGNTAVGKVLTH